MGVGGIAKPLITHAIKLSGETSAWAQTVENTLPHGKEIHFQTKRQGKRRIHQFRHLPTGRFKARDLRLGPGAEFIQFGPCQQGLDCRVLSINGQHGPAPAQQFDTISSAAATKIDGPANGGFGLEAIQCL